MSVGSRLKGFDFYRHIPVDLTEPTAPGAILSIFAVLVMAMLFFGEVASFIFPPIRSNMIVAADQTAGRLRLNVNMTFHRFPCFALGLDVVDALGRHEMGGPQSIHKTRVSRSGVNRGEFHPNDTPDFKQQADEGCNVQGFVMLNKVPGNFHVSSHGLADLVSRHLNGHMDLQHTIHSFWAGTEDYITKHAYKGENHPLDGVAQPPESQGQHYEYYIDVVPTVYSVGSQVERAYQLAAATHKQNTAPGEMPAAMFRYQLSPITVTYSREQRSFIHFVTYVCAIIGGVYTVAGLANRVVHRAAIQVQRTILGKAD